MDYLALSNLYVRKADLSGSITSVTAIDRQTQRVVSDIKQSWLHIQGKQRLSFLWDEFSFATQVGVRKYSELPTDFKEMSHKPLGIVDVDNAFTYIEFVPYDVWVLTIQNPDDGRPNVYTINPKDEIEFKAGTDKVYTVTGMYYKQPQELINNTDTPIIDSALHIMIVYHALIEFGLFEAGQSSPLIMQGNSKNYKELYRQFVHRYTESIRLGDSLEVQQMGRFHRRRNFSGS